MRYENASCSRSVGAIEQGSTLVSYDFVIRMMYKYINEHERKARYLAEDMRSKAVMQSLVGAKRLSVR